jgi:hypothetical protein
MVVSPQPKHNRGYKLRRPDFKISVQTESSKMGGDNKEYVSPCPEIDLPVVDLSENSLGGPNRKSVVKKLIDSFSTFGFCLITGLEGYDEDALFKAIEWFYYGVTEKERLNDFFNACIF